MARLMLPGGLPRSSSPKAGHHRIAITSAGSVMRSAWQSSNRTPAYRAGLEMSWRWSGPMGFGSGYHDGETDRSRGLGTIDSESRAHGTVLIMGNLTAVGTASERHAITANTSSCAMT